MKVKWLLSGLVVLATACQAVRADTLYKLDNNYADNEIVGDRPAIRRSSTSSTPTPRIR